MKKSEFRSLIREEIKKTLMSELFKAKFKLPKEIRITHVSGKRYLLEYKKSRMTPTISEAQQIVDALLKQFKLMEKEMQANPLQGEARIYIRDERMAIGLEFTSKLGPDDMWKVTGDLDYVD